MSRYLTPDEVIEQIGKARNVPDPSVDRPRVRHVMADLRHAGLAVIEADTTPPDETDLSHADVSVMWQEGIPVQVSSNRPTAFMQARPVGECGHPLGEYGTCELADGHEGDHAGAAECDARFVEAIDNRRGPEYEGLAHDPREEGCWLGRMRDVPGGWQYRAGELDGWRTDGPLLIRFVDHRLVQARPAPQPESVPRWTVSRSDEDGQILFLRDGHAPDAQSILAVLNAAEPGAPEST